MAADMPRGGRNVVDLTGQKFGNLTVVRRAGSLEGRAAWLCECVCNRTIIVRGHNLTNGSAPTRSCGCARRQPIYQPRRVAPGESARRTVLYEYKVAAAARGLSWSLTEDDFDALTAMDCAYCNTPPRNVYRKTRNGSFTYNGIDRVDNTRGYDRANVVPCCRICNRAKGNLTHAEFVAWLDRAIRARTATLLSAVAEDAVWVNVDGHGSEKGAEVVLDPLGHDGVGGLQRAAQRRVRRPGACTGR